MSKKEISQGIKAARHIIEIRKNRTYELNVIKEYCFDCYSCLSSKEKGICTGTILLSDLQQDISTNLVDFLRKKAVENDSFTSSNHTSFDGIKQAHVDRHGSDIE